jgi:hypothetical protein
MQDITLGVALGSATQISMFVVGIASRMHLSFEIQRVYYFLKLLV